MPDKHLMPPPFHQQQYYLAGLGFFACLLLYTFGPARAAEVVGGFAATFLGFMVGKFTNGFPRTRPTRWDDKPEAKKDD